MRITRSVVAARWWAGGRRHAGKTVGFVPTMGALHAGHLALVARSKRECGATAVSIFVNPTQFGRGEDFGRYPRTMRRDAALLRRAGVDLLFAPSPGAIYPPGDTTRVSVPALDGVLCGRYRPGHFTGVATVVAKLLNVIRPHRLYLGQKDAQQCVVLQQLVQDMLYVPTRVVVCPTVRERDGLAMSSRNAYLSPMERNAATVLIRALRAGALAVRGGEQRPGRIRAVLRRVLSSEPMFRVQYAEAVSPTTLRAPVRLQGKTLLAVAGHLGRTRLIDNVFAWAR